VISFIICDILYISVRCLEENYLCASQWTAKVTARNDSCVVTIVGYRGNRVVVSISIWVTCGRFLRKAPTK
jgi:hypothetical protein